MGYTYAHLAPPKGSSHPQGPHSHGVLHNLGSDLSSFVTNFIPGIEAAGGAIAHDVTHPGSHSQTYDQILKPLLQSWKADYYPFLPGGPPASQGIQQIKEHPLGPILDVAGLVTDGIGEVAKGASVVAKVSRDAGLAEKAAAFAGREATDHTPAELAAEGIKGVIHNKHTSQTFVPKTFELTSKNIAKDSSKVPPISIELPHNPLRRAIKENVTLPLRQKLSDINPSAPIIGSERTLNRAALRKAESVTGRPFDTHMRTLQSFVSKFKPAQKQALLHMIDDVSAKEYRGHVANAVTDAHRFVQEGDGGIAAAKARGEAIRSGDFQKAASPTKQTHAVRKLEVQLADPKLEAKQRAYLQAKLDIWNKPELRRIAGLAHDSPEKARYIERLRQEGRNRKLATERGGLASAEKRSAELAGAPLSDVLAAQKDPHVLAAFQAARKLDALAARHRDPALVAERRSLAKQVILGDPNAVGENALYRTSSELGAAGKLNKAGMEMKAEGTNIRWFRDHFDPSILVAQAATAKRAAIGLERQLMLVDSAQEMTLQEAVAHFGQNGFDILNAPTSELRRQAQRFSGLFRTKLLPHWDPEDHLAEQVLKNIDDMFVKTAPDTQGKLWVVSKTASAQLTADFRASNGILARGFDGVTALWKSITLTRPGFIVNNIVSNLVMLYMAHGPWKATKALIQQAGKKGEIVSELGGDILHEGFGAQQLADMGKLNLGKGHKALLAIPRGAQALAKFTSKLNQKIADGPFRKAAFVAELDPLVKVIRESHPEVSWNDAARMILENDDAFWKVAQRVAGDLVDFNDMSQLEKDTIKRAMPFWSWVKGSSKVAAKRLDEHPGMAAVYSRDANQLQSNFQNQYGDLPIYTQGFLNAPIPDFLAGKQKPGTKRVLTTQAWNPLQTPLDAMNLARSIGSGSGGDNPVTGVNPVIQALIAATTGRDPLYGTPVSSRAGAVGTFAKELFATSPEGRIIGKELLSDPAHQQRMLYDPAWQRDFLGLAGFPVKDLRLGTGHSIVQKQRKAALKKH